MLPASSHHISVNYHDWPWQFARPMGKFIFWVSLICALADTADSGWFLTSVIGWATTNQINTLMGAIIWVAGSAFAATIYGFAQIAMFMTSGHAETISASRSNVDAFGLRAKKPINKKVALFFTYYEVILTVGCVIYMVGTDLIGFAEWLWHGGLPGDFGRFVGGVVLNIFLVGITFFGAYKGLPTGIKIIEYSRHEEKRERGEEEEYGETREKRGGNTIATRIAAVGNGSGNQRGRNALPSPGHAAPPKALGPGRSGSVLNQTTMHLAQDDETEDDPSTGMPPLRRLR